MFKGYLQGLTGLFYFSVCEFGPRNNFIMFENAMFLNLYYTPLNFLCCVNGLSLQLCGTDRFKLYFICNIYNI